MSMSNLMETARRAAERVKTWSLAKQRYAARITAGDMAAFGASHAACYKWPEDTVQARACRAAYCDGAAWAAEEIERLQAVLRRIADDDVDPDLKGQASILSGIAWAALKGRPRG